MKYSVLLFSFFIVLVSCHRKTVPAATQTSANTSKKSSVNPPVNNNIEKTNVNPVTAAPSTSASIAAKPVIVVDGKGNMISSDKLPEGVSAPDNSVVRAFTPAQTKNLAYRYKYIPPKILYVPSNLAKTTSRGTYYVYNKKFWYWKQADGFFYLDPNYYN